MMDDEIRAVIADNMTRIVLDEEGTTFSQLNASRARALLVVSRAFTRSGRIDALSGTVNYFPCVFVYHTRSLYIESLMNENS